MTATIITSTRHQCNRLMYDASSTSWTLALPSHKPVSRQCSLGDHTSFKSRVDPTKIDPHSRIFARLWPRVLYCTDSHAEWMTRHQWLAPDAKRCPPSPHEACHSFTPARHMQASHGTAVHHWIMPCCPGDPQTICSSSSRQRSSRSVEVEPQTGVIALACPDLANSPTELPSLLAPKRRRNPRRRKCAR